MSELEATILPQLPPTRKNGDERFLAEGNSIDLTLLDFWQWSVSDLVSNTTRGRLAEFIVASALGLASKVRNEWDTFDLCTASGLRIEVKSCAYLQSWFQKKPSSILFQIPKTRAWDGPTNTFAKESQRQANIYVCAILAHREKTTLEPLNLDQWHFYPVLTSDLDARTRSQQSITLKSLQKLCPHHVSYYELSAAINELEQKLGKSRVPQICVSRAPHPSQPDRDGWESSTAHPAALHLHRLCTCF